MGIGIKEKQRLEDDMNLLKTLVTSMSQGGMSSGHKAKPPIEYDGQRDDKILENYFWDMEQYLDSLIGVIEEAKIKIVVTYLIGPKNIWWRIGVEDLKAGKLVPVVDTWAKFQEALKLMFKLENSA